MRATIILRGLTGYGYSELEKLKNPRDKYRLLQSLARDLHKEIIFRIGDTDSISERVEFNRLFMSDTPMRFSLGSRRGYNIASFEFLD